jgi:predicted ester cyclase
LDGESARRDGGGGLDEHDKASNDELRVLESENGAQMGTQEENKEIVRRFEDEVFKEGNLDLIDEVLAADAVLHYPNGEEIDGAAAFREEVESQFAAFPDLTQTTEHIIAEDDMVVTRLVVRGTHQGEFMGHAATGNEFEIDEVHIARLEGGKIVERWSQADVMGMLEQLGVE